MIPARILLPSTSRWRKGLLEANLAGGFLVGCDDKPLPNAGQIAAKVSKAVRAAEQLPLASLNAIARMTDGQAMMNQAADGLQVLVLSGSRSQPVSEEQARPAIEQFLLNERKRKLVEDEVKTMRGAVKVEYVGKFAEKAAGSVAAASAAAPVAPTSPAAVSGLNIKSSSKGTGLK